MTVTYTAEVATCTGFGCFLKLLFRWRGSIYKLVWLDLSCFLLIYYALNITYRWLLDDGQKRIFEAIVKYCAAYSNLIPLSFVLGFYVTIVMTRWWGQYTSIPWPDPIAVFVSTNVHGQDERGRLMRRTVMRYVCLCLTMVLSNVSPRVKKRFPTPDHLIEAGLLVESERKIMSDLNTKFPRHSKHWLPIVWAASIITRARKEGRIRDDFAVKTIIDELNKFRGQCGLLISYDTISIPLVYTQVVTLAVYSYFVTCVMGQQWVENKTVDEGYLNLIDHYFPIFTTLQFFFYMGWLKVAEQLINPFGEDDDDFEVNWMVDRNLTVSYLIVDEMHHEHPELIKDQYWDEVFPTELPYTVGSVANREEHPEPSTTNISVRRADAGIIPVVPSSAKIDDMVGKNVESVDYKFDVDRVDNENENDENDREDATSGIHFTARRRNVSTGSSASIATLAGTMSRVGTAVSNFKRFFSREDSRPGSTTPDGQNIRLPGSASSASIAGNKMYQGSMKITDQVIEEVDEQMTITSMRNQNDTNRPTVMNIFGPPPPSAPVNVPPHNDYYNRSMSATVKNNDHSFIFPPGMDGTEISASAPNTHMNFEEIKQREIGGGGDGPPVSGIEEIDVTSMPPTGDIDDEFERLRLIREQERIEREKQKLARSISTQHAIYTEMALDQLTNDGRSTPEKYAAQSLQNL